MLQIRKYDATMSSLQTTLDGLRAEDSHVTLMLEKKCVSLLRKIFFMSKEDILNSMYGIKFMLRCKCDRAFDSLQNKMSLFLTIKVPVTQ